MLLDDVIKWKHSRGIHRSPVNSPHKGQWRRALMFSLIYAWTNDWINSWHTEDLRCHHTHCDVIVMFLSVGSLMHILNVISLIIDNVIMTAITKGPVTLPKIRVNAWITHKFRVLRDTSAICAFHQFFWRGTSAVVRRCWPYRCFMRFQVLSSSKLGFA